jgi:hypothetical protein
LQGPLAVKGEVVVLEIKSGDAEAVVAVFHFSNDMLCRPAPKPASHHLMHRAV